MFTLDEYRAIIEPYCGPSFSFREICKPPSRRHALPSEKLARNIIPTLELANEARIRMAYRCDREGWPFHGLRVNAAYRPFGGASDSQHKHNGALDLDAMLVDWDPATVDHSVDFRRAWYEVLVGLWHENRKEMRLGLYCSRGRDYGVRGHIDCGRNVTRTWQIAGKSTYVKPACAFAIAGRLGL